MAQEIAQQDKAQEAKDLLNQDIKASDKNKCKRHNQNLKPELLINTKR